MRPTGQAGAHLTRSIASPRASHMRQDWQGHSESRGADQRPPGPPPPRGGALLFSAPCPAPRLWRPAPRAPRRPCHPCRGEAGMLRRGGARRELPTARARNRAADAAPARRDPPAAPLGRLWPPSRPAPTAAPLASCGGNRPTEPSRPHLPAATRPCRKVIQYPRTHGSSHRAQPSGRRPATHDAKGPAPRRPPYNGCRPPDPSPSANTGCWAPVRAGGARNGTDSEDQLGRGPAPRARLHRFSFKLARPQPA
jgi:hypothetical protein